MQKKRAAIPLYFSHISFPRFINSLLIVHPFLAHAIFWPQFPKNIYIILLLWIDLSPLSSWVRQKGPFMRNLIFGEPAILSLKLPTLGGLTRHSATSQRNHSPLSASRLTLHTREKLIHHRVGQLST